MIQTIIIVIIGVITGMLIADRLLYIYQQSVKRKQIINRMRKRRGTVQTKRRK